MKSIRGMERIRKKDVWITSSVHNPMQPVHYNSQFFSTQKCKKTRFCQFGVMRIAHTSTRLRHASC